MDDHGSQKHAKNEKANAALVQFKKGTGSGAH
jgi:hypothetical protein